MRHRGLVRLFGSSVLPDEQIPWMLLFSINGAVGTLREVLDSEVVPAAAVGGSGRHALVIASGIADAVEFLHLLDLPHGALSSHVVYLYRRTGDLTETGSEYVPKLIPHIDAFITGLPMYRASSSAQVRWAAPEVLSGCTVSLKSDTWAIGVLIWELCQPGSGVPYSDLIETDSELVAAVGSLPALWTPDEQVVEVPREPGLRLRAIGRSCCTVNSDSRKTVAEVAAELRVLLLSDWEVPRGRFTAIQTLGSGQSGTVTKMTTTLFCAPGETTFVAIKALNTHSLPSAAADFKAEMDLMKRLQHPNLVSLLGVCTLDQPNYIVLEYLAGGSLEGWLKANGGRLLPSDCITIASQVSTALDSKHRSPPSLPRAPVLAPTYIFYACHSTKVGFCTKSWERASWLVIGGFWSCQTAQLADCTPRPRGS